MPSKPFRPDHPLIVHSVGAQIRELADMMYMVCVALSIPSSTPTSPL